MMHRHTQIIDSDKVTLLYDIKANTGSFFSSKPHMRITNGMTGAEVGSVTFHNMTSDIDHVIHGQQVSFDRPGMFTTQHQFQSPTTRQIISWKRDGMFSGGDLKCVNEAGELYALFEISLWAMSKDGKLELGPGIQGPFMDEIIVSGIASMEQHRRQRNRSSGGGGGA